MRDLIENFFRPELGDLGLSRRTRAVLETILFALYTPVAEFRASWVRAMQKRALAARRRAETVECEGRVGI